MIYKRLVFFFLFTQNLNAYSTTLNVAASVYRMEGGVSYKKFLEKTEKLVRSSSEMGADLVLLSELTSLDMWNYPTEKDQNALKRISTLFPQIKKDLSLLASKYKIIILGSSTPRLSNKKSKSFYNTGFFIRPKGRVITIDKLKLTAWEKKHSFLEGKKLVRFEIKGLRAAALICLDIEYPDVSMMLAKKATDLIFVSSMTESDWALERVTKSALIRSLEHHALSFVSGTIGKVGKDWEHFGLASGFSPLTPDWSKNGFLSAVKSHLEPEIKVFEINKIQVLKSKEKTKIYPSRDMRKK